MNGSAVCVIRCGRDAEQGYLCAEHYSKLAGILRDIEDQAAIVETVPSMAQRTGTGKGGLPSHRVPVVLDALVALDPRRGTGRIGWDDADPWGIDDTASILETLHSRARTVREDCEIEPPAYVTVSGERDFLSRSLPWIAAQPWVDEMYDEMADLLGQLHRTNKTGADKPVGYCHLTRFESICGGRIWQREEERVLWRVKDDRCAREKVKVSDGPAYCERCRAQWDGKELDRLRLIEEQRQAELARPKTSDGRRMLTAAELAVQYRTSENAIRLRLSKAGARATHGHYDPLLAAPKEEGKSCA